jgi:hypothetical protein
MKRKIKQRWRTSQSISTERTAGIFFYLHLKSKKKIQKKPIITGQ